MYICKMTIKGQITIPKALRKKLGTNIVELKMEKGRIYIEPVKEVGGILSRYAKPVKTEKEIQKRIKEEKAFYRRVIIGKTQNNNS